MTKRERIAIPMVLIASLIMLGMAAASLIEGGTRALEAFGEAVHEQLEQQP